MRSSTCSAHGTRHTTSKAAAPPRARPVAHLPTKRNAHAHGVARDATTAAHSIQTARHAEHRYRGIYPRTHARTHARSVHAQLQPQTREREEADRSDPFSNSACARTHAARDSHRLQPNCHARLEREASAPPTAAHVADRSAAHGRLRRRTAARRTGASMRGRSSVGASSGCRSREATRRTLADGSCGQR